MENQLIFAYDPKGDILDISLGKPKKAISREIADDFFVRFDPKSGKILGFSLINFEKGFAGKKERSIPMKASFALSEQ